MVRILIADDHEVVRRGLRALLETQAGWQVCAEAATGRDAVEKATRLKPNVAILDIGMPELNGLEATRHIVREVPDTEVLILTVHESEQVVREVLSAGARGYLFKSDAGTHLLDAVRTLIAHRPYFTPRVADILLSGYLNGSERERSDPGEPLTPREREVLQLLAEGRSNKEVASKLGISTRTAESHRQNLMHKLNLHSMNDLVRYAVRNNIIQI